MNKTITFHHGMICATYALLFYTGAILDMKVDKFFMLSMPAAAWYFIFIYTLSDAVTEIYGPKKNWEHLLSGYFICFIFVVITTITIHLPYAHISHYRTIQSSYSIVENAMLKCFSFGYLVFFVGMFINIRLLGKWKLKYKGQYYFLRSYAASSISEGFVDIFSNFLIWYNRISLRELIFLTITCYLAKLILTLPWALVGLGVKNLFYCVEGGKNLYIFNTEFRKKINLSPSQQNS